jgi:hypothetical protein
MLNDLIRGFVQKLPERIRPEICFRLVVFLDASRLADTDLEKTTVELLAPADSLDRFRTLVLSTVGDRRHAPAEGRNGGTNADASAITANLLVRSEPIYADVR